MAEDREKTTPKESPILEPLKKERKVRKLPFAWTLIIAVVAVAAAVGGVFLSINFTPPEPEAPEYVDKSLMPGKTRNDVTSVAITSAEGTLVVLRDAEGKFYVQGSDAPINQTEGADVFYSAATVSYEVIVEKNPKDLSVYGLDKPTGQAVCVYTDGSTKTFIVGNKTSVGSTYYLMMSGDDTVYTVWTNHGETFASTMSDLYEAQLAAPAADQLATVKVERKGEPAISLENVAGSKTAVTLAVWRMHAPYEIDCDWEKTDPYTTAAASLKFKRYVSSSPDVKEYGLDEPVARVTVLDKQGVGYDVEIGGSAEYSSVYARKVGTPEVFTMDANLTSFLATKPLGLIDRFVSIIKIDAIDSLTLSIQGQPDQELSIVRKPEFDEKGERVKNAGGEPTYVETFFLGSEEVQAKAFKTYYQVLIGRVIDGVAEKPLPGGEPMVKMVFHRRDGTGADVVTEFLPYDRDFYAVSRDGSDPLFVIRKERVDEIIDGLTKLKNGDYNEKE